MINRRHNNSRRSRITANRYIKYPKVRVLDEFGEMIGVMDTDEARDQARSEQKDLVLITENAKPPVCKIIDIAKYKYQQQQKKAEGRKRAKSQEIKEVRFTPFMSENDFQSRFKKVERFLKKGDKVRLSLLFKGRAITKKEFGYEMYARIIKDTEEIATVEMEPKMMGKKLIAQLMPVKKKN